jgi:hypothetical protein
MKWRVGRRLGHRETGYDNVPHNLPLVLDMGQVLHSSESEELLCSSVNNKKILNISINI